jgi:hypothetical protein
VLSENASVPAGALKSASSERCTDPFEYIVGHGMNGLELVEEQRFKARAPAEIECEEVLRQLPDNIGAECKNKRTRTRNINAAC